MARAVPSSMRRARDRDARRRLSGQLVGGAIFVAVVAFTIFMAKEHPEPAGPAGTVEECRRSDRRLQVATTKRGARGVRRALTSGVDTPDRYHNRPITCAAAVGNLEAARVLLEGGAAAGWRHGREHLAPILEAYVGQLYKRPDRRHLVSPVGSSARVQLVRLLARHGASADPLLDYTAA